MIRQRYLNRFSSVLALLWGACSAPIVNAQAVKELPKSAEVAKAAATSPISADIYTPSDNCRGDPKWLVKNGLSRKTQFDTTRSDVIGLSVVDSDGDGKGGSRRGAHRTWSMGGYLGRLLNDQDGHIYAYPVPLASLDANPIAKSNVLYRIDTETMEMASFAEIPKSLEGVVSNPYGIVATTFDCGAKMLYVASIYGSTASEQRGLIARVNTTTREVKVVKRGLDVMAMSVVNSRGGKRLVVGTARDNQILSFSLSPDGETLSDQRLEVELDAHETARDKVTRILRFDARGGLYVRSVPFDYTLAARATIPMAELWFKTGKLTRFELARETLGQLGAPVQSQSPTDAVAPTAPEK